MGIPKRNQHLYDNFAPARSDTNKGTDADISYGTECGRRYPKVTGMETGIKWPNDIVMKKKKVCGILTEMSTEIDYINYVVIGVGINVNQKVFDEELKEKATSLMIETGAPVKRSALIAAVMKHFEKNYALFMENGDLSGLQESYNEMLVNRGKEVRILEPGNGSRIRTSFPRFTSISL